MKFPSPYEHILPEDIPCTWPPQPPDNTKLNDRIRGSMLGLAIGDALGASVEFRSYEYLLAHPVHNMQSGGTWSLQAGQWTDDTSMALCLASSLITKRNFDPYNQMVRYKWWYKHGFLASTGHCFDIGKATRQALDEFSRRQHILKSTFGLRTEIEVDHLSFQQVKQVPKFDVNCSQPNVAGNGALMRLAPVPLYFFRNPVLAVELSGQSARLTHGSQKAIDACRYYGALIVAALRGERKGQLLSRQFYNNHRAWFGSKGLCKEVRHVAFGSYKKPGGYEMGIRGRGYVINALEAALWAFWSDQNSFQNGVLAAVNLGDDTDTTAAIYGQLAGAYYGRTNILPDWLEQLYANGLITCISDWLYYLGHKSSLAVKTPNDMFYRISTRLQQKHLLRTISTHDRVFGPVVSRRVNKIKKASPRSHICWSQRQKWMSNRGLVYPNYQ
ncbi:unnamed protein product [Rotaria sp. Silwood2]|nr:unnamed protein product [Rotaria sp. Silwood2]CAF4632226.1 unnamed protein product [Rotaria sp. Silwood2]